MASVKKVGAQDTKKELRELKRFYSTQKKAIEDRLREFEVHYDTATEEEIFAELAFCLFTPQSKALNCWRAVGILTNKGLLLEGKCSAISKEINIVRFRNHKAEYLVGARRVFTVDGRMDVRSTLERFGRDGAMPAREWLVENIKGLGYKEASHFLRNIGWGRSLAILDRHILKNMVSLGALRSKDVEKPLSRRRYLEIEERLRNFSAQCGIPLAHLDLLLWSKETGQVFK